MKISHPPIEVVIALQDHGLQVVPLDNDPRSPDRHYQLGGYSGVTEHPVLMPSGHGWGDSKPDPEHQAKNGFDSENCSNYGTHNCLETLAQFKGYDDFPKDCSERYSGCLTGTTPTGNDPHYVIETIRDVIGVVPEADLPFTDDIADWASYYTLQAAQWLLPLGKQILNLFRITHEWVFQGGVWTGKPAKLMDALQYGPVAVSVRAWQSRHGKYFKDDGDPDNHWVQLLDYDENTSWTVYDDYDGFVKVLEWHYDFYMAKVYYMDRIATNTGTTFWSRILLSMQKIGLLARKKIMGF